MRRLSSISHLRRCRFFCAESESSRSLPSFSELVNDEMQLILKCGGEKAMSRHVEKNKKILVRSRVQRLLDPGSPFLEIAPYAACGVYGHQVSAAGIVAGIGIISGERCIIIANDATVKGGTLYPTGVKKQVRLQDIAMQNDLPVVYLVDSGGAFLPLQSEIFPDRDHGGRVFYNEALMSAAEIPSLSVVCGSCTAGGAYVPAMSDESVIVDRIGTIFLGGPPLVQAATGEVVSAENLGGAKVHCDQSGLTDHFAADELEAVEMARRIVKSFNTTRRRMPLWDKDDMTKDPTSSCADWIGAVPLDAAATAAGENDRIPMRRVLDSVLDGDSLAEFKPRYGESLLTGYANLGGHPVGVVASAAPLLCAKGCKKGAHFVQLCSQRQLPVLFLQNVRGFAPPDVSGSSQTAEDTQEVLKASAAMMQAVARSDMPKITVIVGDSVGPANYAMCGRSQNPNFLYVWPNARIRADADVSSVDGRGEQIDALFSSARIWDDGIVRPEDMRLTLEQSLDACRSPLRRMRTDKQGVFRM